MGSAPALRSVDGRAPFNSFRLFPPSLHVSFVILPPCLNSHLILFFFCLWTLPFLSRQPCQARLKASAPFRMVPQVSQKSRTTRQTSGRHTKHSRLCSILQNTTAGYPTCFCRVTPSRITTITTTLRTTSRLLYLELTSILRRACIPLNSQPTTS